jgi:hypothetical protein
MSNKGDKKKLEEKLIAEALKKKSPVPKKGMPTKKDLKKAFKLFSIFSGPLS